MKPLKIPRDHKFCPKCNRPYGFLNCRVSLFENNIRTNLCLDCASERVSQRNKTVNNLEDTGNDRVQ